MNFSWKYVLLLQRNRTNHIFYIYFSQDQLEATWEHGEMWVCRSGWSRGASNIGQPVFQDSDTYESWDIHIQGTRSGGDTSVSFVKHKASSRPPDIMDPQVFNALPVETAASGKFACLKNCLEFFLIDKSIHWVSFLFLKVPDCIYMLLYCYFKSNILVFCISWRIKHFMDLFKLLNILYRESQTVRSTLIILVRLFCLFYFSFINQLSYLGEINKIWNIWLKNWH